MDNTVMLLLISVLAVVAAVWRLFKDEARDLLGPALLVGAGMLLGAGLEMLFPAGFLVGTLAGLSFGVPRLWRAERNRIEATAAQLLEAPDTAASLLIVHDRLDELAGHGPQGGVKKVMFGAALVILALAGLLEIAIGMSHHIWQFLLAGSGTMFLVATSAGRMTVEVDEGEVLYARLRELQPASAGPRPLPNSDPEATQSKPEDGRL